MSFMWRFLILLPMISLGLSLSSFAQEQTFKTPACSFVLLDNLTPAIRTALIETLDFISSIQGNGASALHQEIFSGSVDKDTYCGFLKKRVFAFTYDRKEPYGKASIANYQAHVITLTSSFSDLNLVSRAGSIIHEARHADIDYHIRCPDPFLDSNGQPVRSLMSHIPLSGLMACDDTGSGSYGTEVIWYQNIFNHCTNCSLDLKNEANAEFQTTLVRIFDLGKQQEILNDR